MRFHPLFWINVRTAREKRDNARGRSRFANEVADQSRDVMLMQVKRFTAYASCAFVLTCLLWGVFALFVWTRSLSLEHVGAHEIGILLQFAVLGIGVLLLAGLMFVVRDHLRGLRSAYNAHYHQLEQDLFEEERKIRDNAQAMGRLPRDLSDMAEKIRRHHHLAQSGLNDLRPAVILAEHYNCDSRDFLGGLFAYLLLTMALFSVGAAIVILEADVPGLSELGLAACIGVAPLAICIGWARATEREISRRRETLERWDALIDRMGWQVSEYMANLANHRGPLITS